MAGVTQYHDELLPSLHVSMVFELGRMLSGWPTDDVIPRDDLSAFKACVRAVMHVSVSRIRECGGHCGVAEITSVMFFLQRQLGWWM
jgi:hypothetical protein